MHTESIAANLVALTLVPGVGRSTLAKIFYSQKKHGWSWSDFWVAEPSLQQKIPISEKLFIAIQKTKKEQEIYGFLEKLKEKSIRVIVIGSSQYPQLLAQSERPPVLLFAKGAPLNSCPLLPVAVVGTRRVTSYGCSVTTEITKQLCQAGATIVSGCMYGVDTVAHLAALAANAHTVAVLGFGFDYMYPASQDAIVDQILTKGGTIISEYPPATRPTKGNFIARNSIVAGMSLAVVVTEAAKRSGSHTTAQFALESGRSVCAVPGPIQSPYSEGTKWLINEGAVLVSSANDILTELGMEATGENLPASTKSEGPVGKLEQKIIAVLQTGPQQNEDLFAQLSCSFAAYQACLTKLELGGYIDRKGEKVSICY
ncbi:MAG: DNA-protecting protein DprA [Candidatus Pacebacteria bacterium CG10_big_fil_rev_8_21_14_0_10_44_54]|nr:MAG: DNA-protecting protein DprA [Candidatus Pacebacteria bacterium CG10_big_fil_rev_8_21_14_0_10_44_54]